MTVKRIAVILLLLLVGVTGGGGLLPAAQVDTDGVEALADQYGLDRGDTRDLVRSFRGAVNVGVDPRRLESLLGQALAAGMEIRYLERAVELVTGVTLDGLPPGPMLNKLREGLAKRVDGRGLVEAMEQRALTLKRARRILSVAVYGNKPLGELETILVAVTGALERGASERSIERIFEREGPDLRAIVMELEDLD